MKKVFFILGVLLSLGMFCACSSDDDNDNVINGSSEGGFKEYKGEIISPIEKEDQYSEISDFLNTELRIDGPKGFFVDSNEYEDICITINSMKELQDLYSGDKDIPDIDFQKYTLIIGKKSLSHSYHWIIKQELVLNNGQLELYLYIPHLNSYYSAIQEMGFWGLYHKLQAKEISLNVIEVDD